MNVSQTGPCRDVRSRQALGVNVRRRLLVEPQPVQRFALPLLAALHVGFKGNGALTACTSPPPPQRTMMVSIRSATPLPGILSTMASFGIVPVPCCPTRPSRMRCGLSRSVSPVGDCPPKHTSARRRSCPSTHRDSGPLHASPLRSRRQSFCQPGSPP